MFINKIKQILVAFVLAASVLGSALQAQNIIYTAHVAGVGWQGWVSDGQTAGTTGQGRQMEAVAVVLSGLGIANGVQYRAHASGLGWMAWVANGAVAGTTGQGRRLEAVQIALLNPAAGYSVRYRAHVSGIGWLGWVSNGAMAGTTGQSRQMEALEIAIDYSPPPAFGVPAYEPAFWNNNAFVRANNNCYNYTNNKRTDSFAQPGRGTGQMYSAITGSEMRAGAIRDGLVPTTATAPAPGGMMRVALVIAPGFDFHWYRQDSNGMWSHKPGGTAATNVDNSGNPISNPESANRGPYIEFWGYFFTPVSSTQGVGYANIF